MTIGSLGAWTGWLLETSFRASLLIGAVFLVRLLAGRRLSAQWRHALWLLVMLRLVLPWTPQSRFSIYGLVPSPVPRSLSSGAAHVPESPGIPAAPAFPAGTTPGGVLGVIWLIGASAFVGWLLLDATGTVLALRGRRPVTEKAVLDLLEDCKQQIGIQTYLPVVETPRIHAPALFGWIRPRLLVPAGVLEGLSQERLRHVFLHELAHLRRHDIAFNWLAAVAQALHWFNPLVWLALREARTDMEMACDELAIARLSEQESGEYGHTVLDLVTVWPPPKRSPMVAAIGEDGTGIKRRIQMIAAFKKRQRVSYLLPAVTLLLLAAVFLVDAREGSPQPQAGVPRTASEKAPPVDAAMKSASGWLALLDAGDCGSTWTEAHSVARGMLSRETWTGMCTELRRLDSAERGKVISRNPVGAQYIPNLPLGLGDGVSVTFRSKYERGEYRGPKLLLAADKDGVWRSARTESNQPPHHLCRDESGLKPGLCTQRLQDYTWTGRSRCDGCSQGRGHRTGGRRPA